VTAYSYKPNRQTPKIEAQAVGEELERIRGKRGELTAENVVAESRPKEAVLHEELDLHLPAKERAELWSRHKARNVINVVQVVSTGPDGKPTGEPVPAYVNITEGSAHNPDARNYQPIDDVLSDPVKRANMVQRAMEKLMRVQREFRHLRELEVVWAAIDALATAQK
jgi:hypothetical protein